MENVKTLASGKCDFVIEEAVSKSGRPYKRIKIKIGDYELQNFLFCSDDCYYIIKSLTK